MVLMTATSGLRVVALVGIAALSGCGLPRSAPTPSEVLNGAEAAESRVEVVPVNRSTLENLRHWPQPAGLARTNWPTASGQPVARTVRAGDQVQITVWDSARDSLIATESQRVVQMQAMAVSSSGRVFIPYVGEVQIAGLTADAARAEVERQFRVAVPDGQVQLAVTPGGGNTIDVVTGVARPGRVALPETSPTILSVIAEAGGISPSLRNPLVRLNRAGRGYAIPARTLFSDPARDIVLRGGDRILVEEDQRSFLALGAAGRQSVVPFTQDEINALDALSQVGGLSPARANLQGLMVLRAYPERVLRGDGRGPQRPWVVFTFDMTNAEGIFAAGNFRIAPNDVVLATESPLPAIAQIIGLIRGIRSLE
jgi:polysaccharide biosynthesis/export protein